MAFKIRVYPHDPWWGHTHTHTSCVCPDNNPAVRSLILLEGWGIRMGRLPWLRHIVNKMQQVWWAERETRDFHDFCGREHALLRWGRRQRGWFWTSPVRGWTGSCTQRLTLPFSDRQKAMSWELRGPWERRSARDHESVSPMGLLSHKMRHPGIPATTSGDFSSCLHSLGKSTNLTPDCTCAHICTLDLPI